MRTLLFSNNKKNSISCIIVSFTRKNIYLIEIHKSSNNCFFTNPKVLGFISLFTFLQILNDTNNSLLLDCIVNDFTNDIETLKETNFFITSKDFFNLLPNIFIKTINEFYFKLGFNLERAFQKSNHFYEDLSFPF